MVYDSLVECNVPTFEVRPFIDNKYLLIAAILCGGESFKFLKTHIKDMSKCLIIKFLMRIFLKKLMRKV